jgi:hypothetical protein
VTLHRSFEFYKAEVTRAFVQVGPGTDQED